MTSPDDTTRTSPTTGPDTGRASVTDSVPTSEGAAGSAPTAGARTAPEPTYRTGPAPFPILLGLLGLLTALGVLVAEWTDLSLPWTDLGPWTIVLVGLVVVVVGVLGLRSSTRGRD